MSCLVSLCLLLDILLEFLCEVNAGLVGKAEQYPQHVSHLVSQVVFLSLV